MLGQTLAVCAGLCAALASTAGKLAMASEATLKLCTRAVTLLTSDEEVKGVVGSIASQAVSTSICTPVVMYIRIFFFALIFLFNALMWTFFVKALQSCSSIAGTATNTAANFCFTALLGWLLFGEQLELMWWCGASMVIMGLILIHRGQSQTEKVKVS